MATYLVCEGKNLDTVVLRQLVIQLHAPHVNLVSVGGSTGLGAVRTHYEQLAQGNVAIRIEDRDYRPLAEADQTWSNTNGRRFIWRRHEIENYLFHPAVVLAFFDDLRSAGQTWAHPLPTTEADVDSFL